MIFCNILLDIHSKYSDYSLNIAPHPKLLSNGYEVLVLPYAHFALPFLLFYT